MIHELGNMHHKTIMSKVLSWFLLTALTVVIPYDQLLPPPVAAAVVSDMPPPMAASLPSCPSMCGDVRIPYPFGIGDKCSWAGANEYFTLTCRYRHNAPRPYWANVEVIDISVETGEMRVFSPVSYICYNSSNTTERHGMRYWSQVYTDSPLLISPTRNEFTAIGCNTLALLEGREDWSYYTGCITSCVSLDSAARDGDECTGLGCCQTSISSNLSNIEVYWRNGNKTRVNRAWSYSPCSYAFIAEKGWYNFSRQDLVRNGNDSFYRRAGKRTIPLVLDWAIRSDGSCRPAQKDGGASSAKPTASACVSPHSYCVDAPQGNGYLCKCSEGYAGNPYVTGPGECTNINECELRKSNPAKYEALYPCQRGSICHDIQGDYKCTCKFGLRGDGKSDNGCQLIVPIYGIVIIVLFVVTIPLVFLIWLIWKYRKQRTKKAFFDKNGGTILKDTAGIVIFTQVELDKITDHYKTNIGSGAFGTVYIGTTDDKHKVAVKRSLIENKKVAQLQQGGEFLNQIKFQIRNTHRNLVRLVGCCLETNIPILVYEYISNGSLYHQLHVQREKVITLPTRLNIAIGSAEALAYMHSNGEYNHIHGDVKSANILLDDKLMPKVSDFGSSRLLSTARYARNVLADMSYIDPRYLITNHFVPKSDVYSFGIVLLELITRKKVNHVNDGLSVVFVKFCKEKGSGREMYDNDILSHDGAQCEHCLECLDKVGALAVRCLMYDVDDRPAMAEVVEKLTEAAKLACT